MTNPTDEDELRQEALNLVRAMSEEPQAAASMIARMPSEQLARIQRYLLSDEAQTSSET
jgi:hypothetical protein